MTHTSRIIPALAMLAALLGGGALQSQAPGNAGPTSRARISESYRNVPLSFEENRGQTDPRVRYLARGEGYTLFLTSAEAVLALRGAGKASGSVLRMRWEGGSPSPRVTADGPLPGTTHYRVGKDPSRWRTGVPSWTRVHYQEVWPGIDLVFYGNPRQLEHDAVVAPGADPRRVRLAFDGADKLRIDAAGDLVVRVAGEEVRLRRPVSYQEMRGRRQEVESAWRLLADAREVGFRVGPYDRTRPLVIDPVLAYSTYLGGSLDDGSYGGTADAQGNLYVTGSTNSPDFPLASAFQSSLAGNYDVFVTKLDRHGALVYSTYLGGSGGEQGEDMAADNQGNVILTGSTDSPDFPRVGGLPTALAGGGAEAFVTKLGPGGEIVFSTLLGGSQGDFGYGVGLDAQGRVYVAGATASADFPIRGGLFNAMRGFMDGFVVRLSRSGSELEASTYLGGSEYENVYNLAVDPAGYAYVVGSTNSRDFPLANPPPGTGPHPGFPNFPMGFLTKLSPSLSSLVYSTFFANGQDVTADAAGNTYVVGLPSAPVSAVSLDACATKLSPAGALLFSTCVGGSSDDWLSMIAVDLQGNIILAGSTASPDFPLKEPIQSQCAPLEIEGRCFPDLFVTKLDRTGREILFSTYLGGTQQITFYPPDEGVNGLGVDAWGDIYLAGWTYSADFPTVNAVQPEHGGGSTEGEIDAIAVRISFERSVTARGKTGAATASSGLRQRTTGPVPER